MEKTFIEILKPRRVGIKCAFVYVWSILHKAVNAQQESNTIDWLQWYFKKKIKIKNSKKKILPASSKFQKFGLSNYSLIFLAL